MTKAEMTPFPKDPNSLEQRVRTREYFPKAEAKSRAHHASLDKLIASFAAVTLNQIVRLRNDCAL